MRRGRSARVLVKPHDRPVDDEQVRAFVRSHRFGQLVAPGRGRDLPIVVPTHYACDGDTTLLMHFSRQNPVWDALREHPRALFTVIGDYVYVPTSWNAGEEAPPEWGVPTSYYASVQHECDVRVVDDPDALAALLRTQLADIQPEGGHADVTPGDNPYARQMPGIRGLALSVTATRAKFKYGGNRPAAHRERVDAKLAQRGGPMDAEARGHIARTLGR